MFQHVLIVDGDENIKTLVRKRKWN